MNFEVDFTERALKDIKRHIKSGNKRLLDKLDQLLDELEYHPETGTGKPEKLKHISGYWSRRINKKHRLVYTIDGKKIVVTVISAYGHYED
ncbi:MULTISPECIES: Txe/YoeB family addiction module toxin [Echinicola]|uniref:Putative mRNA interferase YoeB n=2 Tax=Echinicola TaxID=390846 RepID=A0A2Z4IML1_9BACT|nr:MULTISPECIES: Txe/YoeB family addiction module toxin [Echinicola]AWW31967.1 Txe/YoeB family addiction module toxin [Echinicola strongylocentroti]GGF37315.1 addiction module antitoxin RelB [Echinicola rosea]